MSSPGKKAEQKVRIKLAKRFNTSLEETKLAIGKRLNGSKKEHKFDLVSPNKRIVGEVKSYKLSNKGTGKAGYTTTRRARLLEACFYLQQIKAKKKILVLTNKALFKEFNGEFGGMLKKLKIEVIHEIF